MDASAFESDDDDDALDELDVVDELCATPVRAQRTHDGVPIRGYYGGEPVPDLSRIAQERWLEVLRPLRERARHSALGGLSTQDGVSLALQIIGELIVEDGRAADRARQVEPPGLPAGGEPLTAGAPLAAGATGRALYEERRDR